MPGDVSALKEWVSHLKEVLPAAPPIHRLAVVLEARDIEVWSRASD